MDQPLQTSYYFTDEQLDLVSLVPAGKGLTAKEMQEQISSLYGEPDKKNQGPYGMDCVWLDEQTGMQIELIPGKEDFEVEIRSYTPKPQLIARFSPEGILVEGEEPSQPDLESLKDLCGTLFWTQEEAYPAVELVFESDGEGGNVVSVEKQEAAVSAEHQTVQAGASLQQEHDRETAEDSYGIWEIRIDPADFWPVNKEPGDRTKALKMLARTYGQLLQEAEPERYAAGYEQLLQTIQERPAEIPDAAPGSGITRAQNALPEFADAFAMYILAEMPQDSPGSYQECVRYFDQFEELNTYRSTVRTALGLQTEE